MIKKEVILKTYHTQTHKIQSKQPYILNLYNFLKTLQRKHLFPGFVYRLTYIQMKNRVSVNIYAVQNKA